MRGALLAVFGGLIAFAITLAILAALTLVYIHA